MMPVVLVVPVVLRRREVVVMLLVLVVVVVSAEAQFHFELFVRARTRFRRRVAAIVGGRPSLVGHLVILVHFRERVREILERFESAAGLFLAVRVVGIILGMGVVALVVVLLVLLVLVLLMVLLLLRGLILVLGVMLGVILVVGGVGVGVMLGEMMGVVVMLLLAGITTRSREFVRIRSSHVGDGVVGENRKSPATS